MDVEERAFVALLVERGSNIRSESVHPLGVSPRLPNLT